MAHPKSRLSGAIQTRLVITIAITIIHELPVEAVSGPTVKPVDNVVGLLDVLSVRMRVVVSPAVVVVVVVVVVAADVAAVVVVVEVVLGITVGLGSILCTSLSIDCQQNTQTNVTNCIPARL